MNSPKKPIAGQQRTTMESSSLFNDLSERNLLSLEQFDVRVQIGARLVEMAQKKKKNVKEDVEKLWLAGFHAVIAHINSKEHHDDSTLDLFRRNIADAERFFVQLAKVDESLHAHCLTRRGDLARYMCNAGLKDAQDAKNLYLEALKLDPSSGHTHNQLGVLALQEHDGIEAMFRFLLASKVENPFGLAKKNLEDAVVTFRSSLLDSEAPVSCVRRVLLLAHLDDDGGIMDHFNRVLETTQHFPTLLLGLSVIEHKKLVGINATLLAEFLNELREPEDGEMVPIGTAVPEIALARTIGLAYIDEVSTSARVRLVETLRVRRIFRVAQALDWTDLRFDGESGMFIVSQKRLKASESLNVSSSFKPFQSSNRS